MEKISQKTKVLGNEILIARSTNACKKYNEKYSFIEIEIKNKRYQILSDKNIIQNIKQGDLIMLIIGILQGERKLFARKAFVLNRK